MVLRGPLFYWRNHRLHLAKESACKRRRVHLSCRLGSHCRWFVDGSIFDLLGKRPRNDQEIPRPLIRMPRTSTASTERGLQSAASPECQPVFIFTDALPAIKRCCGLKSALRPINLVCFPIA